MARYYRTTQTAARPVDAELKDDMARVAEEMQRVSFDEEVERYQWPLQVRRWLWTNAHYKGLAAYCKVLAPQSAIELGTRTGASAVCLAKFCDNVVTCDVTDWAVADASIFGDRVTFFLCTSATDYLEINYGSYDLVHVDVDKGGALHQLLHQKLIDDGFEGDAFYDDIGDSAGMQRFWGQIQLPKLELDWHETGFGVVRYGRGVSTDRHRIGRGVIT